MAGLIYLLTNTVNGKRYVGQTSQTLAARVAAHRKRAERRVGQAMRKYGRKAFIAFELERFDSQEELDEAERFWIGVYRTCGPLGYNSTTGGERAFRLSDETRRLLSEQKKRDPRTGTHLLGAIPWNKGRKTGPLSEEHRRRVSATKRTSKSPGFTGRKHSAETLAKISAALRRKREPVKG